MALDDEIEKKFFTIGEISKMFDVRPSLIRFYEKEFDFLKPIRRPNNRRYFTPKQIEQLKIIFTLTREHKFTLDGVKGYFKNSSRRNVHTVDFIHNLQEIRDFLIDLEKKF